MTKKKEVNEIKKKTDSLLIYCIETAHLYFSAFIFLFLLFSLIIFLINEKYIQKPENKLLL